MTGFRDRVEQILRSREAQRLAEQQAKDELQEYEKRAIEETKRQKKLMIRSIKAGSLYAQVMREINSPEFQEALRLIYEQYKPKRNAVVELFVKPSPFTVKVEEWLVVRKDPGKPTVGQLVIDVCLSFGDKGFHVGYVVNMETSRIFRSVKRAGRFVTDYKFIHYENAQSFEDLLAYLAELIANNNCSIYKNEYLWKEKWKDTWRYY